MLRRCRHHDAHTTIFEDMWEGGVECSFRLAQGRGIWVGGMAERLGGGPSFNGLATSTS